jgi:hypothetical protein
MKRTETTTKETKELPWRVCCLMRCGIMLCNETSVLRDETPPGSYSFPSFTLPFSPPSPGRRQQQITLSSRKSGACAGLDPDLSSVKADVEPVRTPPGRIALPTPRRSVTPRSAPRYPSVRRHRTTRRVENGVGRRLEGAAKPCRDYRG